jgi:hypothetical protein
MDRKALLKALKECGESVRLKEVEVEQARLYRANVFQEGKRQGLTQQEMANLAKVSIQTVQADLRLMKASGGNAGGNNSAIDQ